MAQQYSNPKRATDPYSLPDVETFEIWEGMHDRPTDEDSEPIPPGWYWQACFPGCLPDGEPIGPFDSEADALADAQEGADDDA